MAISTFRLPDLGEGLTEADVVEWYVAEGESVALDQPVVALESAKAVVDIPSPVAGRVRRHCARPGETVATGAPLVEFEVDGEIAADAAGDIRDASAAPSGPPRADARPHAMRRRPQPTPIRLQLESSRCPRHGRRRARSVSTSHR